MIWGYALVWMPQYLTRDPDPLMAKLKFLKQYGLQVTGIGMGEVEKMSEAQRETVGQYLAENDLYLHIHVHFEYLDPDLDEVKRSVDRALKQLDAFHKLLRTPLVTTGAGPFHRFMRQPSLQEQMDRLAAVLPPLAEGCHQMGLPFGIENHGDYYCSDLVELCQRVPHLGIFLDTGNTYLIGEAPLPAFHTAAPHVVGTHFKDHHVRPCPDARPLHFEVGPSVIGDGDVPLLECYRILQQKTPDFESLVMEIEFIPPRDIDPVEAFEAGLSFVRSLE